MIYPKLLAGTLWLLLQTLDIVTCRNFTMGYLTGSQRRPGNKGYPRPGLTISGAISLAVDEINTLHPLKYNHTLTFTVAETYGEESESIYQTALLWTEDIAVYIGPQETCVHEAKMAASFDLPMISYFCAHHEISDKNIYPTFVRTRPPDTQISKSVASLLLNFKWMKVAFLYSTTQDRNFKEVSKTILQTLESVGIEIRYLGTWPETYHYGYGENPFDDLVEESYLNARIYVILGYYFEHLGLMVSMEKRGLLNKGDYYVVGVDIEQYESQNPRRYLKGLLRDEIEDVAKKAFQSYLGVVGSPPVGFEDFTVKVNKYMQLPPFNFPNPVSRLGGMKRVPAEGAYLYDAIYVYARALNECLFHSEDPFKGRVLIRYIKGRTYFSAMGYMVYMDENGDAEGNYTLIARKPVPNVYGEYGLYPVGVFQLHENRSAVPVLQILSPIDWVGGTIPTDEPPCGFLGEKCVMWKLAIGVTGGLVLVLLIGILVAYKNWAYEQELDSLIWKIEYKDIQVNEYTPTTSIGRICRSLHPLIRTSQVSLSSNAEADFRYTSIFTTVGIYKGRMLAIKRLKKKSVDITRKMKKELKLMRDLRHDNLNSFIGACIDPPNICIVTDYCSRGSLKDILENEDVKLDNMFHASLIGDIVRGMTYLHDSPLRSHGNLKSSKCLVDSRWVVKIADFGLHELKFGADSGDDSNTDFEKQCAKLLWRAPELLRDPNSPQSGTPKGDVYSFGIILYEIIARNGPYGQIDVTPSDIIKNVMRRDRALPFRPRVSKLEDSFDCIVDCMQDCWAEEPDIRPDFKTIRTKLRPMRKGMKPNIFDNMLVMMEKYANNLEALVDGRTDQLIEEKKKTDALLYEMLPKYVADQLKKGNKVEAESFECVTIYFSDIVGFTTMSAQSSPLQVVDFLNDLYTCFDAIIENYDVYKVETIGDAYMVVSGLPIKNGDIHAAEIASMALHLLEAVKKFVIKHRPKDSLMLRIGIHSGAVCAGVVGQKMPRYCLFGDTVNTASRMESTGLPLRIHCSEACKILLDKLGGYKLDERGVISIKGKGEMSTYWLEGQEDYRVKKSFKQNYSIQTPDVLRSVTRSSLRHSKFSRFNPNRRLSLESQKKIRFASSSPKMFTGYTPNSETTPMYDQRSSLTDESDTSPPASSMVASSSANCALTKGNSCPCLGENCEMCVKPRKDVYEFVTPRLALENVELSLSQQGNHEQQRNTLGWRKMSRFSSFLSCLGSGEVNEAVDNGRLPSPKQLNKHLSIIGHSESEPFLPQLRYHQHTRRNDENV
ncbi:hypothetical protein JTE90_015205 [Oedothorax gibbosus]|uniref:Guanylate cyclase n=1 Tax=Oedothorax gibbosus TaxID=931172 RepID=A0AAV6VA89_9ARAC|nr:hypothetical protein JTE90_015205 [Oedothorax gibbosus]